MASISKACGCLFLGLGLSVLMAASNAWAIPVAFDLRETSAAVEIESGVIVRGGVTATLTPFVSGGIGSLNQTTTGFGVDATGSGDDTDALDDALGVESISVHFSQDVFFSGLALSLLTASQSDVGGLTIGSFAEVLLSDTGAGNDVFNFTSDNFVSVGESVVLRFVSGNGFSFDSFSVETVPTTTAVPDASPGWAGLSALVLLLLVPRRRGLAARV